MSEMPNEMKELIDNVAYLNAGIALVQTAADAGEDRVPENVLIA